MNSSESQMLLRLPGFPLFSFSQLKYSMSIRSVHGMKAALYRSARRTALVWPLRVPHRVAPKI